MWEMAMKCQTTPLRTEDNGVVWTELIVLHVCSFDCQFTDLRVLFQNMDKKMLSMLSKCLAILEREQTS